MMDFSSLQEASKAHGEKADCAVKAVAVAAGVEYGVAHNLLKKHGRKDRSGTYFDETTRPAMGELGFELVDITYSVVSRGAKTVRTFGRMGLAGTFMVRTRRHILAAKDGKVIDWTDGRMHRILAVYRVVKRGNYQPGLDVVEPKVIRTVVPASKSYLIKQHATACWEQAGKPTDIKVLRKLRQVWMDELEAKGFKRTTCSTTLGEWQKEILK